jgi:radical SAM protein with 4Fe4S-binding SPASM domain
VNNLECSFLYEFLEKVELKEIYNEFWSDTRIPLGGGIELTNKCNLSCVHCYAQPNRNLEDLTFNEITTIVDQLVDEGTLFLYLTGGEVLLRPDFPDIYKYIRLKGIMVEILTNGTLIDDKIIDLFTEYPPLKLDITIYGMLPETYEKITQVKGSYNQFMSGIDKLIKNNIPFELKTVGLNINQHEILDMKKYAQELGVNFRYSFNISPMVNGNKSTTQYRVTVNEALFFDSVDSDRKNFWSRMKVKPRYNIENFRIDSRYRVYLCKAGKNNFLISASGMLYACIRERCHGYNLLNGTFKEGWDNHILNSIREKTASDNYPCLKCENLKYCDHCAAESELENGNPELPVEFRCELAKRRAIEFEG